MSKNTLTVMQYRSAIRTPRAQRRILESLGLRRLGAVHVLPDCDSVRGMVRAVPHLVKIVEGAHAAK